MRVFAIFCCCVVVDTSVEINMSLRHMNNTLLSDYELLWEVGFVGAVYLLATDRRKIQATIVLMVLLYTSVWVVDQAFYYVQGRLNGEMAFLSRAIIIVMSVLAVHTVARTTTVSLIDEPIFWVSTANIIYATGALFIYGFMNDLLAMGRSYFEAAWNLNWWLAILANLMFMKGFMCKTARPQ